MFLTTFIPSSQTTISYMSDLSRPRSLASSIIWAVVLMPSLDLTSLTRGAFLRTATTSSVVVSLLSWATTVWTCISVVDAFIAIVLMSSQGMMLCTSGPWCVGSLTEGSRPFIGPFLLSPGSAARLTMVTNAFSTLNALSIGLRVLSSPVVLHETTRESCAPHDSE